MICASAFGASATSRRFTGPSDSSSVTVARHAPPSGGSIPGPCRTALTEQSVSAWRTSAGGQPRGQRHGDAARPHHPAPGDGEVDPVPLVEHQPDPLPVRQAAFDQGVGDRAGAPVPRAERERPYLGHHERRALGLLLGATREQIRHQQPSVTLHHGK
ncbi:hypothetical protein GCM10020001_116830 [Nonomuraea salmonea]